MKKIITCLVIVLNLTILNAQQDAMYTHYSFNMLTVNPGYAGSRDAMTLTALHRSQWVGFEGAPVTESFTIHAPIFKTKMGIGLSALNDKIGPVNNSSIYASYSYKLKFKTAGQLALGVNGGINVLQTNLTNLIATNTNDPTIANNTRNYLSKNFGFGAYYTYSKYFVGLSIPKLIKNKIDPTALSDYNTERRHVYLSAGAVLKINNNLSLRPTTLIKFTQAAPIQTDLTAMFIIQNTIEIGGMFRTGDAFGLLLGYNLPNHMRIGYSFDWSYGVQTARVNAGSHELMIRYDFINKARKRIVSPRYF
ncbi:MAG: type IX secretion system membrane protein PorP/SprF [Flavobacteriia bacterium]|nr:type IX secretion system membrane protein PorP/SprF [Flavobacteriia bacterium]